MRECDEDFDDYRELSEREQGEQDYRASELRKASRMVDKWAYYKRDGGCWLTPKSINDCLTTTIKNGVVTDMPRDVYDRIRRLNPSSIAAGLVDHREVDPAAVKWAIETPSASRAAAAQDRMDRGTLAHLFLLQPERIVSDVAIWCGAKRAGAEWDNFESENVGKLIIRQEDYNSVATACKSFRACKAVANLLTDLDAEVAMFSEEFGIYTKGLVDAVTRGSVCNIIDIKTTEAGISYKQAETTIRTFRNREKMAAYKHWYAKESGREVVGCFNVFLSMEPPYAVRVVKISTMALEWGLERVHSVMREVKQSLDSDSWPMFVRDDVSIVADWEAIDEEMQLDFA